LAGEETLVCESFVAIVASAIPSANVRVVTNDLDPADQWIRSIVFFNTINIEAASFVRAHSNYVVHNPSFSVVVPVTATLFAVKVSKNEKGTVVFRQL